MEIRMPLTLVTQANLTDCGLACTAIVARQKLETVLRIAIKECGYPKDGPHTTTDENLFKLLDHFGIKYGKKQKVKTVRCRAAPPSATSANIPLSHTQAKACPWLFALVRPLGVRGFNLSRSHCHEQPISVIQQTQRL